MLICFIHLFVLKRQLKGVKEKITAIEGHVEYAQIEFQTLHNETIPAFEDKQMDETNQHLALELWGRKIAAKKMSINAWYAREGKLTCVICPLKFMFFSVTGDKQYKICYICCLFTLIVVLFTTICLGGATMPLMKVSLI
jgi:hypothetical protein